MRRHVARIPGYAETVRHMPAADLRAEMDKLTRLYGRGSWRQPTPNRLARRRDIEQRLKVLKAEVERRDSAAARYEEAKAKLQANRKGVNQHGN